MLNKSPIESINLDVINHNVTSKTNRQWGKLVNSNYKVCPRFFITKRSYSVDRNKNTSYKMVSDDIANPNYKIHFRIYCCLCNYVATNKFMRISELFLEN